MKTLVSLLKKDPKLCSSKATGLRDTSDILAERYENIGRHLATKSRCESELIIADECNNSGCNKLVCSDKVLTNTNNGIQTHLQGGLFVQDDENERNKRDLSVVGF